MNRDSIQIAKNTLNLLKKKSWNDIELKEVYKTSRNKNKIIKTKEDLLKNINRYIDYLLKNDLSKIEISTSKDMLFEVIMARFDIIQKHRKSFLNLFNLFKHNPQKFIKIIPSFIESVFLMASLANIKLNGVGGSLKIKGIFIIYIATFFEWSNDQTNSLEKTMTVLDRYLERTSSIYNYFKK